MRKYRKPIQFAYLFVIFVALMCLSPTAIAKKGGNGGGKPGGEDPPPVVSCAHQPSAFPAFAFNRVQTGRKGRVTGYDIYLSNAAGDCEVRLVSVNDSSGFVDLSFRQNGSSGTIAWRQTKNENGSKRDGTDGLDLIKVIRFEVNNKEVISSSGVQVVKTANDDQEYNHIDLSPDASSMLVVVGEFDSNNIFLTSLGEMDLLNCASECSLNVFYDETNERRLFDAAYSPDGNRIYFSSRYLGLDSVEHPSQGLISFMEEQNGFWSAPKMLTLEGNGFYGTDFSQSYPFRDIDVNHVDLGNGLTEAVSYTYSNPATLQSDVHVIDVGSCSVSVAGDCISSGDSSLFPIIADAQYASFHYGSLLFSSASSDSIYVYNFSSESLISVGSGDEAESGQ